MSRTGPWSAELRALHGAVKRLDMQTVTVLIVAALVVILQMQFGDRRLFRMEIAPALGVGNPGLWSWGWWFGMQGILGFVLPVLLLKFGFGRSLQEMGLGKGDSRLAWQITAVYLPLVIVGTWILSAGSDFQAEYPHYAPAAHNWRYFAIYEGLFLFYWVGWEYLWRGFVLFGTRHTFGVYAIFVQAMPFAILHMNKPLPEALLSIVGGVALGALVWRTRAFWIAVPIHAAQMLILDFWATLRIRSGGSSGLGWEALKHAFSTF